MIARSSASSVIVRGAIPGRLLAELSAPSSERARTTAEGKRRRAHADSAVYEIVTLTTPLVTAREPWPLPVT